MGLIWNCLQLTSEGDTRINDGIGMRLWAFHPLQTVPIDVSSYLADSSVLILWNGVYILLICGIQLGPVSFLCSCICFGRMNQQRIGHRRLRLCSKKNAERKKFSLKHSTLPVSIPLSDAISVFKISLPIDLLSFNISLPVEAFLASPASSLDTLKARLAAIYTEAIPPGLLFICTCTSCTACLRLELFFL